ncbi:DegT/DnrJ/EryC1/StrS family aminotransferase [soil metagenome]
MPGPGRDLIGDEEIAAAVDVLRSGYLYRYGPDDDPAFKAYVRQLEERVAEWTGVRYALATSSGTSSLWISVVALGVGSGDEVIVPGFTFIASISSIVYARATPVLAEVDATLNLDPADVEARITPRTRAIMAVHMLGNPARIDQLRAIADRHGLALIEDCAQAFGASYGDKKVGSFGTIGGMSFNEYKTITAGDGGMVVTDDEALYRRAFALHDQGHSPLRKGVEVGERPFLGLNFRMIELAGAVILAQMGKLDRILSTLRRNRDRMQELIADLPGLSFRELPDPKGDIATHLVVIFPTSEIARAVAADLGTKLLDDSGWHVYTKMEHLQTKRMPTDRGCPFQCTCHGASDQDYSPGSLPQTDDILSRAMTIGIGVSDRNLGSAWGIGLGDGEPEIQARAAQFREAAERHLD